MASVCGRCLVLMETDFCSLKQDILMGYYLYQHVPERQASVKVSYAMN